MNQETSLELIDEYSDAFLPQKVHKTSKQNLTKSRKSSIDLDKSINRLKTSLMLYDKKNLSTLVLRFYTILILQHLMSFLFCICSTKITLLKTSIQRSTVVFIVVFLLAVLLSLSSVLKKGHLRKVPENYFLLGLFSLCYCYILCYICLNVNEEIVLMVIFNTFVITLILILYVSVSPHKFSLVGTSASVIFTGMLYYFFIYFYTDIGHKMLMISLIWLYIWGFYLIFWTRKLKHKYYKLKGNDYILVSFKFYVAVLFVISFVYGLKGHEL